MNSERLLKDTQEIWSKLQVMLEKQEEFQRTLDDMSRKQDEFQRTLESKDNYLLLLTHGKKDYHSSYEIMWPRKDGVPPSPEMVENISTFGDLLNEVTTNRRRPIHSKYKNLVIWYGLWDQDLTNYSDEDKFRIQMSRFEERFPELSQEIAASSSRTQPRGGGPSPFDMKLLQAYILVEILRLNKNLVEEAGSFISKIKLTR